MVQKFSGHLSVQMILRYTHPADGHSDAALDKMSVDILIDLSKTRNAEKF